MDENNEISLLNKLKNIKEEIKQSWYKDCDRTKYMIEFTEMLKEMQTKESLEEYFSNDEQTLTEFKGEILQEIIGNILIQPKIYGENGEEVALNGNGRIEAGTSKTYKVKVEFDRNVSSNQLPTTQQTMNLKVALAYEQA